MGLDNYSSTDLKSISISLQVFIIFTLSNTANELSNLYWVFNSYISLV